MKKFSFTLQDSPDFWMGFEADLPLEKDGEYSVSEENAIAILINNRFPKLKQCHRRIKNLIVVDDNGDIYSTNDFDIYGSLTKQRNNEKK